MTAVKLNAEVWGGTSLRAATEQLVRLAKRLETDVIASFNGVTLIAQPNGTPRDLEANWEEEMKSDRTYKVCNSMPRIINNADGSKSVLRPGEEPVKFVNESPPASPLPHPVVTTPAPTGQGGE